MTKEKQNVAWQVADKLEGHACIVFHSTELGAKSLGADKVGSVPEEVDCFRAEQYDAYAAEGVVPAMELLKAGWWYECAECGHQITADDDDTPLEGVVAVDEYAYCNQECQAKRESFIAAQNSKFQAFKQRVRDLRPDLEFTDFRGEYPWITMTGEFTFAGAKYGGSVRDDGDGQLAWFIANGDKTAWSEYESELQKSSGDNQ